MGARPASLLLLLLPVGCECAPQDGGLGGPRANDGAGRLWVPHHDAGEVRAWDARRLEADAEAPDVVVALPAGTRPNALAFDDDGDLWVTDNAGDRLLEIAAADLDGSGTPTPRTVIESDGASLRAPIGLLFHDDGGLWVAVDAAVEFFARADLDASGPTSPARTLTAATMPVPAGLIVDDDGDLWVTSAAVNDGGENGNAVLVFTTDQLRVAGAQTPRLTLRDPNFALVEGLQLDDDGALWVASNDGLAVARFAAADVGVPAAAEVRAVTPVAALESDDDDSADGRTVRKPGGLLFDADGNLFVNSERGEPGDALSGVLRFSADQLKDLDGPQALRADVLLVRATSNPGFGGLALQR